MLERRQASRWPTTLTRFARCPAHKAPTILRRQRRTCWPAPGTLTATCLWHGYCPPWARRTITHCASYRTRIPCRPGWYWQTAASPHPH